jgi:hypothetical protein
MEVTVDEFTSAILAASEELSGNTQALISIGEGYSTDYGNLSPDLAAYPVLSAYSQLTGVSEPVQTDVVNRINTLVSEVSGLMSENFPEIAIDLDYRAAVAASVERMLLGAGFIGTDYTNETALEQRTLAEDLKLSEPRLKEQWAARGYAVAPGMMKRDLTDQYTAKFQAMQQRRMGIMDKAFTAVLPQFKAGVRQAMEMAMNARSSALVAMTDLIRTSARNASIPGVQYAAMVNAKSAAADALIAQHQAAKVFDAQLLQTYSANLEIEGLVNRYYDSLYPRGVGNAIELAITRAAVAGTEAQSLWSAINVVSGSSTYGMG